MHRDMVISFQPNVKFASRPACDGPPAAGQPQVSQSALCVRRRPPTLNRSHLLGQDFWHLVAGAFFPAALHMGGAFTRIIIIWSTYRGVLPYGTGRRSFGSTKCICTAGGDAAPYSGRIPDQGASATMRTLHLVCPAGGDLPTD
jgi:hypothetical protein